MSSCDTKYLECRVAIWLWKTVPILYLVTGSFGNLGIIAVYARKDMRKISTSVYLLCLGISDFLLLWTSVLEQTLINGYGIDYRSVSDFHCKTVVWMAYSCGGFSAITVMNVTIERAFMLAYPIKAKSKMTPKVALLVCLLTVSIVLGFTTHFVYGHGIKVVHVTDVTDNSTHSFEKCSRISESFDRFYKYSWDFIVMFFFNFIPFCVIFIGNISICVSIQSSRRKVHSHANASISTVSSSSTKPTIDKGLTIVKILFVISFGFAVTTWPYFIYFIVKDSFPDDMSPHQKAVDRLVYSTVHMLLYSNFCFNFFIYITMSTLFKKACKRIFNDISNICKKK